MFRRLVVCLILTKFSNNLGIILVKFNYVLEQWTKKQYSAATTYIIYLMMIF
jgi:hypothetical protein